MLPSTRVKILLPPVLLNIDEMCKRGTVAKPTYIQPTQSYVAFIAKPKPDDEEHRVELVSFVI